MISLFRRLGRPFTLPLLLFALVLALTTLGRGLVDSLLTRLDEARSVHRDGSRFATGVERQVPAQVTIVLSGEGDERRRVLADAEAYAAFVRDAFADLEAARVATARRIDDVVAAELAPVEAATHDRVAAYADWYYAWPTTYRLLYEAGRSTLRHALAPRVMSLEDSVGADLGAFLREQYEARVLAPERADAALREVFAEAHRELHGRYLDAIAGLERSFQTFVARETTHLEADAEVASRVEVDWASQLHKLETASHDKGGVGAIARGGGIAAFGLAGRQAGAAVVAGSAVSRTGAGRLPLGRLAGKATGPFAGRAATATGAAAGTAFGGPLGAAVGTGAGLLVDYAVNEGVELAERDAFEDDVHRAVDATFAEWGDAMSRALRPAVEVWFEDAIQLLPAAAPGRAG